MRTQTLVLLALVAVGSTACGRTGIDNAVPESTACGDKVLDGYLVEGYLCANQANPRLPAYQSKQGLACFLDVYLSKQVPVSFPPEACSGEPVTSGCFLEATGFIESVSSDIAGYPRVSLVGSMKTVEVCTLCTAKDACTECRQQAVFVPCQVTGP
jgi:hypothetical protein